MSNEKTQTKVVTGEVRLSYAHIWEPAAIGDSEEKKYSVAIIISKDDEATLSRYNKALEAAKAAGKAKWGGKIPAKLKTPLRDGDEERPDDEAYKNSFFINCTSKTKPGVVDKDLNPVQDKEEVYSGCYARVSFNLYPFDVSGNKGIAAGLANIQKLADGEKLAGGSSAEEDFAEEFEESSLLD